MAFPTNPTNGDQTTVNGITYQYASATNSWTRVPGIANTIVASGNITAGNLITSGTLSVTGNANVGNIGATYFIGNGSQLTGLNTSSISNGTSNISIPVSNGNVNVTAGGNTTLVVTTTGANIAGTLNATGNITGGNLLTSGVLQFAGGSLLRPLGANLDIFAGTGSYVNLITSDESSYMGVNGSGGYITTAGGTWNFSTTGNLTAPGNVSAVGNISGGNLSGTNIVGTLTTASQTNITSVGTLGSLSVTGNVTGGNLLTGGLISATSSINALNLVTRNGDANPVNSKTQIAMGYNGTTDYPQFVHTRHNAGSTLYNTIELWTSDGTQAGTFPANAVLGLTVMAGRVSVGNSIINPGNTLDVGGNVYSTGSITSAGNITSGNLNSNAAVTGVSGVFSGNVSTGNVSGTLGAFTTVTGTTITASGNLVGGNANITSAVNAATVSASGNVLAGNLNANAAVTGVSGVFSGNVSTGNVSGTLGSFTNVAGTLITASQPNITSVGNLSALTVNGAVGVTGNINQTGNLNITGNVNVTGNLNYQNVTDLVVGDPLIFIGANNNANLFDLGIVEQWNDGTFQYGGFVRDATDGVFKVFGNVTTEPTTTVDFTNAVYQPFQSGAATFAGANINGALTSATTGAFSGNVSTGNVSGTTGAFTNVSGTLTTASQPNITSVGTLSSLSVTGNITGGNANITGTTSSTSTTTGALVVAGGVGIAGALNVGPSLTVDNGVYGNVVTTQFASLYATANGSNPYSIVQVRSNDGTTGMGIRAYAGLNGLVYSNTGITFQTGATIKDKDFPTGGTTRATIDSTGLIVTGIANISGNITGGNISTDGLISATGNITGGNLSGTNIAGTLSTAAQTNITSVGTLGSLSVTGNVLAGNLNSNAAVTGITGVFSGNVSANYYTGNGSLLTGIAATSIANGNSNVSIDSAGANVTIGVNGQANTAIISPGSIFVNGVFSSAKNVDANIQVQANTNSIIIGSQTIGTGYTMTVPDSSTVYVWTPT